jgi:hypothetical protein
VNSNKEPEIDERRAAVLTGLSEAELRWLSRQKALGHASPNDSSEQLFFTYEELRALALLAGRSQD